MNTHNRIKHKLFRYRTTPRGHRRPVAYDVQDNDSPYNSPQQESSQSNPHDGSLNNHGGLLDIPNHELSQASAHINNQHIVATSQPATIQVRTISTPTEKAPKFDGNPETFQEWERQFKLWIQAQDPPMDRIKYFLMMAMPSNIGEWISS